MKVLKSVRKLLWKVWKMYSRMFDYLFEWVFIPNKLVRLQEMYCIESYTMTSGGVIVRRDE
ncbi:hypothetical protein EZS27_011930 [termite gut metagenome]|uniref:Uncharacterized protein n=1 Tax=termite gut metagenome TaxID=433724 RepID=A0A5J4S279_9ZZZZ